ncbi:autotransporter outer membrane beta-barrel domain-containing protein [Azospirillum sp. A39]|uniref:autotransporter outer membrane beta-barrel domain-containing protein n=1 Tax=Azospirillum sp. A39 TaxID=3462279 RepID=UPI004045BE80
MAGARGAGACRRTVAALAAGLSLSAPPAASGDAVTGIPGLVVVGTVPAESLLDRFEAIYGSDRINPPFELGTTAYTVRTTRPFVAVRSYVSPRDSPGKAGQTGGWAMPLAEMRGLTRDAMLDRWALPVYGDGTRNNRVTLVVVPAGVTFWSGAAGPITESVDGTGYWGAGGGTQYYLGWGAGDVPGYQVPQANYVLTGTADPGPVLVYGPRLSGAAGRIGTYLDGLEVEPYGDLDRALLTLDVLNLAHPDDAAPLQAAVEQWSPQPYGALPVVLAGQRTLFLDTLGQHATPAAPGVAASRAAVWMATIGGVARREGSATTTGYRQTSWAGMAGVDLAVDGPLRITAGGAYLTSRLDWRDAGSHGDIDTAMLGVHASYTAAPAVLAGAVAASVTRGDVARRIAVADSGLLPGYSTALQRTARGEPVARAVAARLDAGVESVIGRLRLLPFAGLDWAWSERDAFAEAGAGALNLAVDDWSGHSLHLRLGVAAALALGPTWSFDGQLLWNRRLSATSTDVTAGLVGHPGTFTAEAAGDPASAVRSSVGLAARFAGGQAYLRYRGDVDADGWAHAAVAGLALAF